MSRYYFDSSQQIYKQECHSAFNEALLAFGGEIRINNCLPANYLQYLKRLLSESDFAFTPISFDQDDSTNLDRTSCANYLSKAGFDAAFSDTVYGNDGPICINRKGNLSVDINGIRVAVINADLHGFMAFSKVKSQVHRLTTSGCEYIVVYSKFSKPLDTSRLKKLANLGVDLMIFNGPGDLGKVSVINRNDGKKTYVIPNVSLAVKSGKECVSAIFQFRLLRSYEGGLQVTATYVPCVFSPKLADRENCICPSNRYYNGKYRCPITTQAQSKVKALLGTKATLSKKTNSFGILGGIVPQLSLREIYQFFHADPNSYQGDFPLDQKVGSIVISDNRIGKNCVGFVEKGVPYEITEEIARDKGLILAVADEPINGVPTLVVEDPASAYLDLMRCLRDSYDVLSIAITGSIGKTTVTNMVKAVIGCDYSFPNTHGNFNIYRSAALCLQKLKPSHTAFIQEVHGGTHNHARYSSQVVHPDIAILTSIAPVHLAQLGNSIEGVRDEKLGIIHSLKKGGHLLVNNDNEYLQNLDLPVKVVTYGAVNKDSDYYAENIVEHGDCITFTIVSPEGKYDAKIFCLGVHNVCNALGAFATGRIAGISPEKIIAALSRFRTSGFRANLIINDGYKIFADCFNAAPDSIRSAIQSVSTIPAGPGGKRIAVLGDMNELADRSEDLHRETGRFVADSCIDVLITFGELALAMSDESRKKGLESYGFIDRDEMEEKIKEIMRPGDIILFKASHGVELDKTIINIFGDLDV